MNYVNEIKIVCPNCKNQLYTDDAEFFIHYEKRLSVENLRCLDCDKTFDVNYEIKFEEINEIG